MQFDEHFGQLRNANFQGWGRNRNFQVPKFFGDRPEIRRRLTGDSSDSNQEQQTLKKSAGTWKWNLRSISDESPINLRKTLALENFGFDPTPGNLHSLADQSVRQTA